MFTASKSPENAEMQSIYRNMYSGIHQLEEIISDKNQENVILCLESQTRKLEMITNKLNLQDLSTHNANGFAITKECESQIQEKDRKIRDLAFKNTLLEDEVRRLSKELSEKERKIESLNCHNVDSKQVKKGILANFQTIKPKVLVKSKTVDEILDSKQTLQIQKNPNKKGSNSNISLKNCGPAIQDELENPQSRPKSPRPLGRKQQNPLEIELNAVQESCSQSLPLGSPC